MSEKVMLPKEVAEAIDKLRSEGASNESIVWDVLRGSRCSEANLLRGYFEEWFDDFICVLVNGYEVEQTPEENVREYYEGLIETFRDIDNDLQTQELALYESTGIFKTLDLLGIKIAGVNAE